MCNYVCRYTYTLLAWICLLCTEYAHMYGGTSSSPSRGRHLEDGSSLLCFAVSRLGHQAKAQQARKVLSAASLLAQSTCSTADKPLLPIMMHDVMTCISTGMYSTEELRRTPYLTYIPTYLRNSARARGTKQYAGKK